MRKKLFHIGVVLLVLAVLVCTGVVLWHQPLRAQGPNGTFNGLPFGQSLPTLGANPPVGSTPPWFLLNGSGAGLYNWNGALWQPMPQFAQLNADFTDGSGGTALQNITGLSFTLPGAQQVVPFNCVLFYSQATQVSDAFGLADSVAPTRWDAGGWLGTSATAQTFGSAANQTGTAGVAIVTATPTVATVNGVELSGTVQQPAGSPATLQFMVSQATAANVIVIKAGSYCRLY